MGGMKIEAGEDVRRAELFFVDPYQVTVKEELRGRMIAPSAEAIIEMAMSIYDNQQRQPVECRRVGVDKRLQLTLGFTRTAACRLIRDGFTGTDGIERVDANFMLKVLVVDCNDEQALKNNIVENAHRNWTTDIDDAHNQNMLREKYGYSNEDIAKLYQQKTTAKVIRLQGLLQLTKEEQLLVHEGKLSTTAALDLLPLDAEKRTEIIQSLQGEDGKIKGSAIADQVRDHILADNEVSDDDSTVMTKAERQETPKPKFKPRTVKNIRDFFEEVKSVEDTDPAVKKFAEGMLKWVGGRVTDKTMAQYLHNLLLATETEEVEEEDADDDGEE